VLAGAALVLLASWLAARGHGAPGIDRWAFHALALADTPSNHDRAADVVEGSKVTLAVCGLAVIAWLLALRAWQDCAAIVAGLLVTQTVAHLAKAQIERPRPAHPLVTAGGYSFPSTTSAIGMVFLFLAIASTRTSPESKRRQVLWAGALVSALLGLSFIVLRVHYLTDVTAGWALGALAFVLCEILVSSIADRRRPAR
jgi:membrane-associated phospholipid phosphatase